MRVKQIPHEKAQPLSLTDYFESVAISHFFLTINTPTKYILMKIITMSFHVTLFDLHIYINIFLNSVM